jgi:hypothetical protein
MTSVPGPSPVRPRPVPGPSPVRPRSNARTATASSHLLAFAALDDQSAPLADVHDRVEASRAVATAAWVEARRR